MSVEIPLTRIKDIQIRPVNFSGTQEGTLGGPSLPIPRVGDRFAVDVTTTQLRQDAESRQLIAALFQATTDDARIRIIQPNRRPGGFGAIVNGSGQSGRALSVRGLPANAAFETGEFFSIIHNLQRYVYMTAGRAIAGGDGRATVPIWPMLRALTIDTSTCEFVAPYIEGQLVGFDKGAGFERNRTKPLTFSIVERA